MKRAAISQNKGIKLVRKSNDLIEARYNFGIWEARLFSKILTLIRFEDTDFKTFRIYLRDVIKDFSLEKGNASYEHFRRAAENLMGKKFFVPYEVEGGVIRERKYPVIIMADYFKEGGSESARKTNEYIDIAVHPEMKPLLLELRERFTSYDLRNIVKLSSAYTLRIYELLKQYESIGRRKLEVDYLRRIFELTTEYPLFANFYQKIIASAERDINRYTDLTITEIGKVREGKKVVALQFHFHRKGKNEVRELRREAEPSALTAPVSMPIEIENEPILVKKTIEIGETNNPADDLFLKFQPIVVQEFGVTPSKFLQLLEGRAGEEVERAIRVTQRARSKNQIGRSVAGFFVEALRQGFTDLAEEKGKKAVRQNELRAEKIAVEQDIENLLDEQAALLNDRIRELTSEDAGLTDEAIASLRVHPFSKSIIEEKENTAARVLGVDDFRQDRTLREMVKNQIFELRKERFVDILTAFEPRLLERKNRLREIATDLA